MIAVTERISLDESEIHIDYVRASGPGGQNVNKVSTAAQLRFQLDSPSLPDEVRLRLAKLAGKRLNDAGELVIEARRFRTQEKNREDAIARLLTLIRRAAEPPKPRKKTRPSAAAIQKQIEAKRRRSALKRQRRGEDL